MKVVQRKAPFQQRHARAIDRALWTLNRLSWWAGWMLLISLTSWLDLQLNDHPEPVVDFMFGAVAVLVTLFLLVTLVQQWTPPAEDQAEEVTR